MTKRFIKHVEVARGDYSNYPNPFEIELTRTVAERTGMMVMYVNKHNALLMKEMADKAGKDPNDWMVDALNAYLDKEAGE